MKKIAIMIGSLRKESWNRKLASSLMKLAPSSLHMEIVEIGHLPLFNQDLDNPNQPLEEWSTFRDKIKSMDGFLFVTPEYNRSIPAALKNAIDIGSQPYGKSVWGGKPGAVISTSIGAIGGFAANHHLRQTFVFLDILCMQQPEAYIGFVNQIFDANSNITKEDTLGFLKNYMAAFEKWVSKF